MYEEEDCHLYLWVAFFIVRKFYGYKKQTERPHQSNSVLIQPAMDCFWIL